MNMKREVLAEWLDELPAADREARGSRVDLRRLNGLMGHASILARALSRLRLGLHPSAAIRLVELGAGDGDLLLRVARRLGSGWRGTCALLLDRQPVVPGATLEGFARLGWTAHTIQADVFDWLQQPNSGGDIILANLFLHHFTDSSLQSLLDKVALRATCFIAVEPRRSPVALWFSRRLGWIGCNRVTRHDAPVSVRAGFSGRQLTRLWPREPGWSPQEGPAGWFSHRFVTCRI